MHPIRSNRWLPITRYHQCFWSSVGRSRLDDQSRQIVVGTPILQELFERVVPQAVHLTGVGPWPQLALFVCDLLSVVVEISGCAFSDERRGIDGDFADVVDVRLLRFQCSALQSEHPALKCLADDPCDVATLIVERLSRRGIEATLKEADVELIRKSVGHDTMKRPELVRPMVV